MRVLVAVTGASGTIYARQLLEGLLAAGESSVERVGLIVSRRGEEVAAWEGVTLPDGLPKDSGTVAGSGKGTSVFASLRESSSSETAAPGNLHVERFDNDDMFASPASGSAEWDAMVIVPASMGCVGRVAAGVSTDLIARAADVTLKEGRTLIVVPREAPLNLIHLRNLTALAEAGAAILPASPSFYSRPADVEALCATVTDRILARLGVAHRGYRWGEQSRD